MNYADHEAFNKYYDLVDQQFLRDIKAADFRRKTGVRQNMSRRTHSNQLSQVKLPYQEEHHIFHDIGPRLRSSSDSASSTDSSSHVPVVFKTAMCSNYGRGICRFGERCWYAHGKHELRGAKEESAATMDSLDTVYYKNMPNFLGADFDATLAQKQWMKMSYPGQHRDLEGCDRRREPTSPPHLATRFARDSVAAQLRAGVEARLLEDEQQLVKMTAVDRFKAEAEIRPESPMPFSLEEKPPRKISDEATSILASLALFKSKEEKCDAGVCDIFVVSGSCPLGEDCLLKHTDD